MIILSLQEEELRLRNNKHAKQMTVLLLKKEELRLRIVVSRRCDLAALEVLIQEEHDKDPDALDCRAVKPSQWRSYQNSCQLWKS